MKTNSLKPLLLASAMALIVTACQPEKSNDDQAQPEANPGQPAEPYSYVMVETDRSKPQCSTGEHRPENFHQMCLMLLDDELNNECAWNLRWKKFYSECHPKGYRSYESVQCTISILRREAEVSVFGGLKPEDVLDQENACVGETLRGPMVAGLTYDIRLFEKHIFHISMYFQKETDRYERPNATSAKIWYRQNPGMPFREDGALISATSSSISHSVSGPTFDGQNQFHVGCYKVAYCK